VKVSTYKRKAAGNLRLVEERGEHREPMEPTREASPGMICAAHLERAAIRRPASVVVLGQPLCASCYAGKSVFPIEELISIGNILSEQKERAQRLAGERSPHL
jgi:hypothetical protein